MKKINTCNTCNVIKIIDSFYHKDGKISDHRCRSCISSRKKVIREKDYNRLREMEDKWRDDNKDKCLEYGKKYRDANVEVCRERNRTNYHNNIDRERSRTAKKRADRLKRTPPWLSKTDLAKIRCVYKAANRISEKTGIQHHVDHIVPLQGAEVSGLHVPWNLQVIPAKENLSKGNRFDEDMV